MQFLTTKQLLDDILTRIPDNSTPMRAKCLVWLNEAMRMLLRQPRVWEFAKETVTLTVTGNVAQLPADFGAVVAIVNGVYFLSPKNHLTEEDAHKADLNGTPIGYTLDTSAITFHFASADTARMIYTKTIIGSYADATWATMFPVECEGILKRAVLSVAYEVDRDPAGAASIMLDDVMLSELKTWDNRLKAKARPNPHGYLHD